MRMEMSPGRRLRIVPAGFLVACVLIFVGPSVQRAVAQLDLSVFQKEGAGEEQRSKDRYECHRFAVQVTGFDPAVPPPDDSRPMRPKDEAEWKAHRAVEWRKQQMKYNDALSQCMKRRGYTIAEH